MVGDASFLNQPLPQIAAETGGVRGGNPNVFVEMKHLDLWPVDIRQHGERMAGPADEIRELRAEVREDFRELREDVRALRRLTTKVWATTVVGFVAVLIQTSLR